MLIEPLTRIAQHREEKLAAKAAAAVAARFSALSPTELSRLSSFKRAYTASTTPRRQPLEGWAAR
jgi:hypothetical protein